jgi:hypothetical protein
MQSTLMIVKLDNPDIGTADIDGQFVILVANLREKQIHRRA